MNTEIQTLREELQQIKQQCHQAESRYHHAERRFRVLGGLALVAVVGAILVSPSNRAVLAQGYGTTLRQLIEKTQFISVSGGEMYISGTNLHIVNGLGATNGEPGNPLDTTNPVVNGLGNLIIGYNESQTLFPKPGTDVRTGSHNLIVGDFNNYSSYGGLVVGDQNTLSGPYATVSGGNHNEASGRAASVSGGRGNRASGDWSSVSGGFFIEQSHHIGWSAGGVGPGQGDFHSP